MAKVTSTTAIAALPILLMISTSILSEGLHLNKELQRPPKEEYSPYAEDYFPTNVYFGETHPLLSPEDAFADFETFDRGNLSGKAAKTEDMLPKEYARSALREGLRLGNELGANPFKFGVVGSSDAHTALPTTREENYFSKAYIVEPERARPIQTRAD